MMRGYGYLSDVTDIRDRLMLPRGPALPLPAESTLWRQIPRWRDQGQTSSCVGHGVVGALEVQRILDGAPDVALSPAHCYVNARLADLLPGEHLTDSGARIRSGMKIAKVVGIAHEAAWPLAIETIDQRPNASADEDGVVVADHSYERVVGVGEELLQNVLHALTTGPVVFGFDVPPSFEAYSGGVWAGPQAGEQSLGGHCVYFSGYRDGGAQLRLQNSWDGWGETFGNDAGAQISSACWVDAAFVLTPNFGDAWRFGGAL